MTADRNPFRAAVCRSVRQARRERMTQEALAHKLGVRQTYVSRWETRDRPSDEMVLRIEDALGLPHGTILRDAGLVDDDRDIEATIRSDTRLTPAHQSIVLAVYETALRNSAEARRSQRDPANPDDTEAAVADLKAALPGGDRKPAKRQPARDGGKR